jgi:hypothetical protein
MPGGLRAATLSMQTTSSRPAVGPLPLAAAAQEQASGRWTAGEQILVAGQTLVVGQTLVEAELRLEKHGAAARQWMHCEQLALPNQCRTQRVQPAGELLALAEALAMPTPVGAQQGRGQESGQELGSVQQPGQALEQGREQGLKRLEGAQTGWQSRPAG